MNSFIKKHFAATLLTGGITLAVASGFGGGLIATAISSQSAASTATTTISETQSTTAEETTAASTLKTSVSSSGEDLSVSEIAAIASPSVVEITTEVLVTGSRMQQYVTEGAGSGVILTSDGLIATNNHVIADAQSITVRLSTGETYEASLIGTDETSDLAVIKIDASGLPAATLGTSSSLAAGDLAVAIGNPLGELGGTVTDGIISALDREIIIDGESMTLLQTNAAINPGNSGGGLFDSQGSLIGIVNAKSTGDDVEGLGFAIPIDTARPILEQLIQYGYVPGRVDLGMTLIDISTDSAAMMYHVSQIGVYILEVDSSSNAEAAGLASGDLITAVNGTAVETSADVTAVISKCEVGDIVTFTIYRNRTTSELTMTLAESKPAV